MSVLRSYWGEAVLTATYLINRLPSRVLGGVNPVQLMTTFFPSAPIMKSLQFRVFGCVAFVHIHKQNHGKLDPRAVKCVFVGYASDKKGYKCYHPLSRRFFVSMDITFHESESFFTCPQHQEERILETEFLFSESPTFPLLPSHAQETTSSSSTSPEPTKTKAGSPKLVYQRQ